MPKIEVTDNVEFAYHDSGAPPNKENYHTIILIHGHTYHSGTFSPMLDVANSLGYRIILPNRRLYPGSTPYTKEEGEAFEPTNSSEDITKAFLHQGKYLLEFVRNVIQEHDLENVILVGWSLGTSFLSTMVAALPTAGQEIQDRIRETVKVVIWWDPPATAHGIESPPSGGWIPLYDETLAPEERGPAFGQWLAQYYPHPNIKKKDCYTLIYKIASPIKTPSFTNVSFEEFLTKVDLTAGPNGDDHIANTHFQPVLRTIRGLAMFDPKVREAWTNIPFNVVYGDQSPYNVLWAVWQLEAEAEQTGLPIKFVRIPGANHFAMHDFTKESFAALEACL